MSAGWRSAAALALLMSGCLALSMRPPSAGDTAPPINGTDADGKELRLEDYRGKVVVLHFWHST